MFKMNITNFETNDRIMYDYMGKEIDVKINDGECFIETESKYLYDVLIHLFCNVPIVLYSNGEIRGLKFALNNNIKISYMR